MDARSRIRVQRMNIKLSPQMKEKWMKLAPILALGRLSVQVARAAMDKANPIRALSDYGDRPARVENVLQSVRSSRDYADCAACQGASRLERSGVLEPMSISHSRLEVLLDRAIREYCDTIWNVRPVRIALD